MLIIAAILTIPAVAQQGGRPAERFRQLDRNNDSKVTREEAGGAGWFDRVDRDGRRLEALGKSLSILRGVIALDTNTYDLPELMRSRGSQLHRQVFGEDPTVWRDAAPIAHIEAGKDMPPLLVCYSRGMGARVNPVRPAQANAFGGELTEFGIQADVVDASDRNHGEINQWFGAPEDEKVTGRAVTFLNGILASGEADVVENDRPRFRFAKDHFPGTVDATGKPLAGTELMRQPTNPRPRHGRTGVTPSTKVSHPRRERRAGRSRRGGRCLPSAPPLSSTPPPDPAR